MKSIQNGLLENFMRKIITINPLWKKHWAIKARQQTQTPELKV